MDGFVAFGTSLLTVSPLTLWATEAATGVFKPAAPFSSLRSVPSNAAIFGTILCVQQLSASSLELIRRKQDMWNDVVGFAVTYTYYNTFLAKTEKRLLMHNRVVGATVLMAVVYANVFV